MRSAMKQFNLRRGLAGVLAISLVLASSTAMAGGRYYGGHSYGGHSYSGHGYSGGHYKQSYGHHRGYRSYNYGHRGRHYSRHRGHGGGGWVPFAVIGGLAAGYLISESANRNRATTTYATSSTYHGASSRPCHVVHKIDSVDGYEVKSAATMCYDAGGYAYIVQGSEHVID